MGRKERSLLKDIVLVYLFFFFNLLVLWDFSGKEVLNLTIMVKKVGSALVAQWLRHWAFIEGGMISG